MEAGWRAGASDVQCLYREPYDRLFLGRYGAEDWLRIYAAHLEDHAAQIDANVAAWKTAQG